MKGMTKVEKVMPPMIDLTNDVSKETGTLIGNTKLTIQKSPTIQPSASLLSTNHL